MVYQVVSGNTIYAADINELVNVLQQPSGGTEVGAAVLAGPVPLSGAVISNSISSISRGSTPTGVTLGTPTYGPAGGMGTVGTGHITSGGFQLFCINGTNGSTNAIEGMPYTIQY